MNSLNLDILIPTWDRPEQVNSRLDEIALQFGFNQRVHVQVNPGVYDASGIRLSHIQQALTVAQNQANVGFVANVLCGIAHLDADWIWILGDDDALAADCAGLIKLALSQASDSTIAIVHNQWDPREARHRRCLTTDQLFSSTMFGDILFVSGTLWRRSYFLSHLELFVVQAFSCSSQVALLIEGLDKQKGEVLVFNQALIDFQPVHRWSRFQFVQRMPALLGMDISSRVKSQLAYLMFPQWQWATSSALQQVADGEISLLDLIKCSALTCLGLLVHDPFIPVREVARISRVAAFKYGQRWSTFHAVVKQCLKSLAKV